ncbi:uncharacterized protein LOC134261804 [Saccostrea cucullata]|uniref:uncharacterized protein LOC134261804 n=1 Tax=Saccostrea cuccullata TaxID=36930 RepID=UPI002ED4F2AD
MSSRKNIAVTATTGMASTQLGMGATTLHHWCGIMDCRHSQERLHELMRSDDRFTAAKDRIQKADVLFIDEIGMLSKKVFEAVESVCRFVRGNAYTFGGLQVIASGDFKQQPPVPNHLYGDDGSYCFTSPFFQKAFPHHINLKEVIRQSEPDLIRAVNELCDGSPSAETVALMRSLDRPLPCNSSPTFLFGTRFDVAFINQEMLEDMPGNAVCFKSQDEGDIRHLFRCDAPKVLILKEGAPVIITRNLGGGVFNGTRGTVLHLKEGQDPVINIDRKTVPLQKFQFDVYSPQQQRSLACRTQYPVQLAFALTVHKAQGQTLQCVEVDCYSFFAPGQMGVAVGRCVNKEGLKVVNFNLKASQLKHPDEVYAFYEEEQKEPTENLDCCKQVCQDQSDLNKEETTNISTLSETETLSMETESENPVQVTQFVECPWKIKDFIDENLESKFLSHIPVEIYDEQNEEMKIHLKHLYSTVVKVLSKNPETSEKWVDAYKNLNKFVVSDYHEHLCEKLFHSKPINCNQNKFSTKIVFWLMDCEIAKKSMDIIKHQQQAFEDSDRTVEAPSQVAEGKIRYLAGACIHKIADRLRTSVIRSIGKLSKNSRIGRRLSYRKQSLLKALRISEDSADSQDPSMQEILHKQSSSRGLFIVSDPVYQFFSKANEILQMYLTPKFIHLNIENLQGECRNILLSNPDLLEVWVNLFKAPEADDTEEEIFMCMLLDLFADVLNHFIKLAFVDAIKEFKDILPRKKKQALRSKVTALGDRGETKKKSDKLPPSKKRKPSDEPSTSYSQTDTYVCDLCSEECDWEPSELARESIACDKCNLWFHYGCVNIKGDEPFLFKKKSRWICPTCTATCKSKGKGKGKGKGKK